MIARALCLALLASGCATVPPWERAAHAERQLAVAPCPSTSALGDHVLRVKEGGVPAGAGTGSGCGCD